MRSEPLIDLFYTNSSLRDCIYSTLVNQSFCFSALHAFPSAFRTITSCYESERAPGLSYLSDPSSMISDFLCLFYKQAIKSVHWLYLSKVYILKRPDPYSIFFSVQNISLPELTFKKSLNRNPKRCVILFSLEALRFYHLFQNRS